MDSKKLEKIEYLFYRYSDGSITREEMDVLNSLIQASERVQDKYFDFLKTELALRHYFEINLLADGGYDDSDETSVMQAMQQLAEYEKTAAAIEIPKEQPPPELIQKVVYPPREKYKPSKFQIFTLAASAAAILLFVLFVKFAPEPLPSVEVATLTDQMNVQWDESSFEPETGSRLWTNDGPLGLKKGIVSIACDKGVEVVIEG